MVFGGAMLAGFVQAALGVYSAITFHFLCTVGVLILVPYFQITVGRASIYIMCFCPLMDVVQIWNFQDAKRNWPFIVAYGLPEFVGLWAGLAVLCFAMSNSVVVWLQAFLLFSCVMALSNEAYMRYKRWKAEQAEAEKAKDAERECPENTPQDGGSGGCDPPADPHSKRPSFARFYNNIAKLEEDKQKEDFNSNADTDIPSSAAAMARGCSSDGVPSEEETMCSVSPAHFESPPPRLDMTVPYNMVVVVLCGLFAGFSLGAISIGGTFVLLMINTLGIEIAEWKTTQCVAETPLHWARAIIVFSSGMVNWDLEWMNMLGVWIGVCIGLALGNRYAQSIPPWILRGAVLVGIFTTAVTLLVNIVGLDGKANIQPKP